MASETYMIEYCLDNISKLDEWQKEFINSIAELPVDARLSAQQTHKLLECYEAC